jgi:hypothetical protein
MRKSFLYSLVLCLIIISSQKLFAQQSLFNGNSSAGVLNQPVWFNCDYSDTSGTSVSLNYRAQSDVSFTRVAMNRVNEAPYYNFTYEASANYSSDPGILEYYFDAMQDSFMTTQSPKNTNNQFPPASYKYAHFPADPQGDMIPGSAGNWLDLTGNGMTYSDTRLYCYLQNVSGTWPLNQSLTYFAYSLGFLITSGADSAYYAFVYANVPLLLSSGLYIVDLTDSSYTRIGDISYTVSGGILHMACNISTFSADPNWPGWPPPEGYIIPMGATITAGFSGQYSNDYTNTTVFEPQTYSLNFASNNTPMLSSYRIESDSGIGLYPHINYTDSDNNLPILRRLHFDSEVFELSSYDHVYSDSSEFEGALPWPGEGRHYFHFEFSDGKDTVVTALDSIGNSPSSCEYLLGDINNNGQVIGADVTYGVRYFKGLGTPPPDSCYHDSISTLTHWLYASGDVNASCTFTGSDITRLVSYFKGIAALQNCRFFP